MTVPANTLYYFEIVTPDAEATRDLYTATLGWQFSDPAPELGNAFVATLPDGSLCGIRGPMHDQEQPIARNYLRVDDLEKAVQDAVEHGGFLALPPMEIPGRGRIAIFQLGGVDHGLWELP